MGEQLIDEGQYDIGEIPIQSRAQSSNGVIQSPKFKDETAWQQWFMGDGAQVVFWRFRDDGSSVGILFERSRWLSDLIALMPDGSRELPFAPETLTSRSGLYSKVTSSANYSPTTIGGVLLMDETKHEVYRWGNHVDVSSEPVATIELSPAFGELAIATAGRRTIDSRFKLHAHLPFNWRHRTDVGFAWSLRADGRSATDRKCS